MDSNDNQTKYNTPIQNMVDDTRRDSTAGPLIGSIIIILIILIGGLYFWGSVIVDRKSQIEAEEALKQQEADLQRQTQEADARRAEQDAMTASSTLEAGVEIGE